MLKVGDHVTIKSMEWYLENSGSDNAVHYPNAEVCFTKNMSYYCGKTFMVTSVNNGSGHFQLEISKRYWFADWMCVNQEVNELKDYLSYLRDTDYDSRVVTWLNELLEIKKIIFK